MFPSSFIAALLLTIGAESLAAFLMGYRGRVFFAVLALVNLMTNPLLNYILLLVPMLGLERWYYPILALLELGVVLVEWRILRYALQREPKSLLLLSALVNAASFLAGVLIFGL